MKFGEKPHRCSRQVTARESVNFAIERISVAVGISVVKVINWSFQTFARKKIPSFPQGGNLDMELELLSSVHPLHGVMQKGHCHAEYGISHPQKGGIDNL